MAADQVIVLCCCWRQHSSCSEDQYLRILRPRSPCRSPFVWWWKWVWCQSPHCMWLQGHYGLTKVHAVASAVAAGGGCSGLWFQHLEAFNRHVTWPWSRACLLIHYLTVSFRWFLMFPLALYPEGFAAREGDPDMTVGSFVLERLCCSPLSAWTTPRACPAAGL